MSNVSWVKKLQTRFMAKDAIPDGGGFSAGLDWLKNPDRIVESARRAAKQVREALDAVKAAPDNPYGDDDEAIAKAIIEKIEERHGKTNRDR